MARRTCVWLLAALTGCSSTSTTPSATETTPAKAASAEPAPEPAPVTEPAPAVQLFTLQGLALGAVLLPDLGTYQRKVTTTSPEAQQFFNQGLALAYGFNHDEASRAFAKAAALDPSCALCFWGAAYVLGPNYNIPMLPDRAAAAWDALQRAQAAAPNAAPVEQALIAALAKRYKGPEYVDPVAMQAFNKAYADAMREVAKQYPDDLDAQALYAEALMNVNPWKLWTPDGKPAPGTEEIVATLERVLAKDPEHPGANHFYIHAVEASKDPGRALPSADRLGKLMPGAGHIVHMPAHIYQRVGRYSDASAHNLGGARADEKYLQTVQPPGYYPFYLGHNYGFLAYSASMQGRSAEAVQAAAKSIENTPRELVCGMPGMDFFLTLPYLVDVRFGRWGELLARPVPASKYQVQSALYHHARGMALASTGKLAEAKAELAAIEKVLAAMPADLVANLNSAPSIAAVSAKVLQARIAEMEKSPQTIALWQEAVALEDRLAYAEPADWFYPTRHYLGAVMLETGDAKGAEAVYRTDLERNPHNGWALFGLWQSLLAQGKKGQAANAEKQFKKAWADADFELKRSAF